MIPMENPTKKTLTRLKLIGWHYFDNETIHFAASNLLSGENGSGKSTILDALQLVLTTDTRHFNNAANANSKRDVRSYVRGKTGEEGSTAYKRHGSVISYIALEIYEESRDRCFVIGVKIDSPDQESEPKKKWFCEEGTLEDMSFIVDNKPARDDQFKNKGRKINLIYQSSAARERFLHRLGNLQNTFNDLVIKSIAFKPMKDVRSFVSQFILPEKSIDVKMLRNNIHALKSMQDTLAEVKKQAEALTHILSKNTEIEAINRQLKVIDILLKIAALKDIQQKITDSQKQLDALKQQLFTLESSAADTDNELERRRQEYNHLCVAINTNECTRLIQQYEGEFDRLALLLAQAKKEAAVLHTQIAAVKKAAKTVPALSPCIQHDTLVLLESDTADEQQKNTVALDMKNTFSAIYATLTEQKADCNTKLTSLKKEIGDLSKRIVNLKKHNRLTYDKNTTALQNAIIDEFRRRGITSPVRIFADLLEITDTSWQDAIEGYLNTQRFHIIVEPAYYDIAAEVYDRNKGRIHTAALVNTSALDLDTPASENSLAGLIESKNRYARAYANYLLGRVTVCENTQQLKSCSIGITKTCMLYQGKALRKINPEIYRVPFIGKYALKKQLELMENQLREKSALKEQYSDNIARLSHQIDTMSDCHFELILSHLSAPKQCKGLMQQQAAINAKLTDAKRDPTILQLQAQAEELERQMKALDGKARTITENIGKCHGRINDTNQTIQLLLLSEQEAAALLRKICHDHASEQHEAEEKYHKSEKTKSPETIRNNYQPIKQGLYKKLAVAIGELTALQNNYSGGELGTGQEYMADYQKEYEKLTRSDLLQCEEKLRDIQQNCETEFRETFLSKIRENIEDAVALFRSLNKTLRPISYGGDCYQFRHTPSVSKQRLYEMITSKFNIQGFNLFSQQFDEEYHDEMAELFAKLTVSDEKGDDILKEYTDYRNYMDYDIEIISKNGKTQKFSSIYREKSGGETQTPYYVAIAASFSQLYQYGESIRLIILDEAFDKMDEERIQSMMTFFKELHFQIILAAPSSRLEIIGENTDRIHMIYKDSDTYSSIVEEFSL